MPRRLIQLGFTACFLALGLMSACGGEDDGGGTSTGGSSSTGGASATGGSGVRTCIGIAGTWTVSKHCQAVLVGTPVEITQNGCNFQNATFGITGTIDANGALMASGTIPGAGAATCSGTATATMITQNCTVAGQPCAVTLTR